MSPPDHNRVSDWMQERRLSNSRELADEDLKIRSPSLVGGGACRRERILRGHLPRKFGNLGTEIMVLNAVWMHHERNECELFSC